MNSVYILSAHRTDYSHVFIEVFSSMEALERFLANHPEVEKDEITLHEVNPR